MPLRAVMGRVFGEKNVTIRVNTAARQNCVIALANRSCFLDILELEISGLENNRKLVRKNLSTPGGDIVSATESVSPGELQFVFTQNVALKSGGYFSRELQCPELENSK
jgi:hypothetical protein